MKRAMLSRGILAAAVVVLMGLGLSVSPAYVGATAITFELDYEFSGATPPESSVTPWLEATFDDNNTPGSVTLKLEATNLTDAEHVKVWCFNFDPSITVIPLSVNPISGEALNWDIMGFGNDGFKADGDGYFDFLIGWDNGVFTAGEEAVFELTYTDSYPGGITAGSFDFLSAPAPGGGHGPFLSAAHVGGIGTDDDDSGWIAPGDGGTPVPEPATMFLLGTGLVGLAGFRKKFKK